MLPPWLPNRHSGARRPFTPPGRVCCRLRDSIHLRCMDGRSLPTLGQNGGNALPRRFLPL